MESLRDTYRDDDDEEDEWSNNGHLNQNQPNTTTDALATTNSTTTAPTENNTPQHIKEEPDLSEEISEDELSEDDNDEEDPQQPQTQQQQSPKPTIVSDEEDENAPKKKQKSLASFTSQTPETMPPEAITALETMPAAAATATATTPSTAAVATVKKPKKKNNVWTKSTSRKGKKKSKSNAHHVATEDTVLITPIPRFPDKTDDSLDMKICLSKVYKAEKVELSDDRLSAGSSKGYRMVRATRGVAEGAWYFEIKIAKLGETGHTRLGWSTEKGDLQAPVGYDGNSFGYRDIDGSKVHKAVREKYGEEGYVEGDVIGCYINLPEGDLYAPKPPHLVWYKGQRYVCAADGKEESPKVVPGSEISFFKNGVCQGVAFKDLCGGRHYPAASMYTLPNQPNCVVKFNFGPDFEFYPQDFDDRPIPSPMIDVPYHGFDGRVENGESTEKKH